MNIKNSVYIPLVITTLLIGSSLFPLTHAIASDTESSESVLVKGKITDTSHANVNNATVNVTCNGNLIPTTSNASGDYSVTFANHTDCPESASVTVNASSGSLNGSNNATVNEHSDIQDEADIDVTISQPLAVPEFNSVTVTLAGLGSIAAFLYFRKKSSLVK